MYPNDTRMRYTDRKEGSMNEDKIILQNITDPDNCMYQVSTLQALVTGYIHTVVSVGELLQHGDTGLGTFEDVDGEMIALDGHCYRADSEGKVYEQAPEAGVPFGVVGKLNGARAWDWGTIKGYDELIAQLNNKIEEHFGLNSMHILRIDGTFDWIDARSESPSKNTQHVGLKELLDKTQYAFSFKNIKGSVIGLYFPDYMDGVNMPGWHLHFISEDRTQGGHVFDLIIRECHVMIDKIARIEIQLPTEASFDTYDLKEVSQEKVEEIEKGKKQE